MNINRFLEKKPYAFMWPFIVAVLILTVIMQPCLPGLETNGFVNEIIAFEFVENPEDINIVLKSIDNVEVDGRIFQIENMDQLNKIDWLFMIAYSGLLGTFCWLSMAIGGPRWLWLGVVLSIGALVTDFLENDALLNITEIYTSADLSKDYFIQLRRLFVFTWFKWTCIAVALGTIGVYLWSAKKWLARIFSLLLMIPMICLTVHVIAPSSSVINALVLSITLGFLLTSIYALYFKFTLAQP